MYNDIMHEVQDINLRKLFQHLKYFLYPMRKYIYIMMISIIMGNVFMSLKELMLKYALDTLLVKDAYLSVVYLVLILLGDYLSELFRRWYDKIMIVYKPELTQNVIKDLTGKLLKTSYEFYQNRTSAQLMTCIDNVADGIKEISILIFDEFIQCVSMILVFSITVATVHMHFFFLFIIWGIVWIVAAWYWGQVMYKHTKHLSVKELKLSQNLSDLLSKIFIALSFNNVKHEEQNVNNWSQEVIDAEQTLRRMQLKVWIVQGFVCGTVHVLLIGYSVYLYYLGQATIGDVSLIFGASASLYMQIWTLTKYIRDFIETAGEIAQGLQVLDAPIVMESDICNTPLQISKGEIVFDHVQFSYNHNPERLIFAGRDYINIAGGSFVAIVGYSGSGKSTLIHLLMRLFEVTGGKILIDGQDIHQVSLSSLRNSIAIVPQEAGMFANRTIAENIGYGLFDDVEEHMDVIISAAKKAQAHDFIMQLSDGYNTRLTNVNMSLSVGQAQRLSIARGFARDAAIFILDEATSALDNNTQLAIQDDLREIVKGKTTLMIAHRLNTVRDADKILVFDNGILMQEGTHNELIELEGCYKDLWSSQR